MILVLDVLAVHPEYWRKGIGSMLVQSGIHEIDTLELDLDILVRAKKAALALYQKAGFVLVDQFIQDASRFGVKEEYGAFFLVRRKKGND
jgi:ribosomal protein S18 acetylase RimI-like enzyme